MSQSQKEVSIGLAKAVKLGLAMQWKIKQLYFVWISRWPSIFLRRKWVGFWVSWMTMFIHCILLRPGQGRVFVLAGCRERERILPASISWYRKRSEESENLQIRELSLMSVCIPFSVGERRDVKRKWKRGRHLKLNEALRKTHTRSLNKSNGERERKRGRIIENKSV